MNGDDAEWRQSEQVGELVKALCLARPGFDAVVKDQKFNATGTGKSFNYADLASAIQATQPSLSANGLAVLMQTQPTVDGRVVLIARLVHVSDQWFESRWESKATQNTPQGEGSGLTYARKYQYLTVVGIAPEDDDGAAVSRYSDRRERDDRRRERQRPPDRDPAPPPAGDGRREVNRQFATAPPGEPGSAPASSFDAFQEAAIARAEAWYADMLAQEGLTPGPEHARVLKSPDQVRMALVNAAIEAGFLHESEVATEDGSGRRSKTKSLAAVADFYARDPGWVEETVGAYLRGLAERHLKALGVDPEDPGPPPAEPPPMPAPATTPVPSP